MSDLDHNIAEVLVSEWVEAQRLTPTPKQTATAVAMVTAQLAVAPLGGVVIVPSEALAEILAPGWWAARDRLDMSVERYG